MTHTSRLKLLLALFSSFLSRVHAQSSDTEFMNIDCGYEGLNRSGSHYFKWISDKPFTSTGLPAIIYSLPAYADIPEALTTLRYFPKGETNCYSIPVPRPGRYLIRLTFYYLNYDGLASFPIFNVSIGLTVAGMVNLEAANVVEMEYIASVKNISMNSEALLDICLIRIKANPIINAIEIRLLPSGSYDDLNLGNDVLRNWVRLANGANATSEIRYPDDSLDRIWYPDINLQIYGSEYSISPLAWGENQTSANVAGLQEPNYVPKFVGQNGRVPMESPSSLNYTFFDMIYPQQYQVYLYFCELDMRLINVSSRVFDIYFNKELVKQSLDIYAEAGSRKLKVVTLSIPLQQNTNSCSIEFVPNLFCDLKYPIISGIEIYERFTSSVPVDNTIVRALMTFRDTLSSGNLISQWIGDPCSPVQWPGVECSYSPLSNSVVALNLGNANLSGQIDPSIGRVYTLLKLSLANNSLNGQIPDLFGKLTKLRKLYLQNNFLSGSIPESLASLPLTLVNLTNNTLEGVVPFTDPALQISLSGNVNFCSPTGAYNLTVCPRSPVSPPPIPNPPAGPVALNPPPQPPPPARTSTGIIIGTVLAATFLLSAVIGLIVLCLLRAWKSTPESSMKDSGMTKSNKYDVQLARQSSPATSLLLDLHATRIFMLEDLKKATNGFSFSNQIGVGGFGAVFKGVLPTGALIAVKKRTGNSMQGQKEFYTEVELLSRVHHRHLVSLLGFCQESGQQILVYEFMARGSLRDHLYDMSGKPLGHLTWQRRLYIAFGAARGLEYLHTGSDPSIIHRDMKTSNILLDEHFEAHVADLGLSKLGPEGSESHVSTMVKGTAGYLDPEYYTVHKLTDRSDVYSFGVVLLEIITGRQPIDMLRPRLERGLVEWARGNLVNGNVLAIMDPTIQPNSFNMRALWKVAELGILCVEPLAQNRPSMSVVVRELKEAMECEGLETDFFQYSDSLRGHQIDLVESQSGL